MEPIKQGFEEYELKMGAVQTIMASTGADRMSQLFKRTHRSLYAFLELLIVKPHLDNAFIHRLTHRLVTSTGADIKIVNGYLDELNTYADRTIYSFSDMTQSIGKFTNAGVSLDDAVKAIQGISNEAAVSGPHSLPNL